MKNKEKYIDEIIKDAFDKPCREMIERILGKSCGSFETCKLCSEAFKNWCEEEYIEPSVDWSKVEVDTKVLVSDDNLHWHRRYFAEYKDGKIYCFRDGFSSWTLVSGDIPIAWKYVRLADDKNQI